jgi:hypothetical protein
VTRHLTCLDRRLHEDWDFTWNRLDSGNLETIARRPCAPKESTQKSGRHAAEMNKYRHIFKADQKIGVAKQDRLFLE